MSEYIEVGQPLQFTDPNTPTRVGEIVESVSDIYNILSPRLGMQVFVKSEKKSFVITSLKSKVINGVDVPEAAVEAFEAVGAKSITWNNDTDPSNMNDFTIAGVYDIKGERTRDDDNLPVLNTGGGHSFNARLTVLDSSISGSGKDDDKCITQVLSFSNRLGQGEVYIRTGKGSSLDNLTWDKWSTLQRNVNVGSLNSKGDLRNYIDNGIYSGVFRYGSSNNDLRTFVMVVINDYAIGLSPRRVSQFLYSIDKATGKVSYETQTCEDETWKGWEILNKGEIDSMISVAVDNAIKGIIADAPEAFDTLKEIADWIANDETGAVALANAISANAAAIVEEKERAEKALAAEVEKLKNGDTIVGQAREIHSRNGKTVEASFLARTTAGSGTIGDGVASLKSVGGNIVKNLVDKDWVFVVNLGKWQTMGNTTHKVNGAFINVKFNTTWIGIQSKQNLISSHKYYMAVRALGNLNNLVLMCGGISKQFKLVGVWRFVSGIFSDLSGVLTSCSIRATEVGEATFYNPIFIDLTEIFGVGNEPDQATCDKLFGTMDALPQGLNFAKPTEFKSTGFNQFNPDNVLEGKAIVDNGIVNGDKKIAVIPCLPCKVGVGENNGYCIHGDFGDDIKVYLTPLNPMEVEGELYMHELTKDATTDTYVPLINGYMLVEVPTTDNLCAHFLWSEDACDRDSYEPYFESKIELPTIPQMSEWGLAGIQSRDTLAADTIDLDRMVYTKRVGCVDMGSLNYSYNEANNVFTLEPYANKSFKFKGGGAILATTYTTASAGYIDSARPDKTIYAAGNKILRIYIKDSSYTNAESFKASLQGVMLYYELATPEEYPLPKVTNNYTSSDYGVEQFDSVVPCNANNLYYMRSLAGETRNFLDRLMAGLGTSDATVVADRILAVVNPAVEPANVEPEIPIEE